MFAVKDEIVIVKNKKIVGHASVVDVCIEEEHLHKYFQRKHPMYPAYLMAVNNGQPVYIVDYEGDLGRAGYFKKNIRKKNAL